MVNSSQVKAALTTAFIGDGRLKETGRLLEHLRYYNVQILKSGGPNKSSQGRHYASILAKNAGIPLSRRIPFPPDSMLVKLMLLVIPLGV